MAANARLPEPHVGIDHDPLNLADGKASGPICSQTKGYNQNRAKNMAALDWSQCPAVESIPGKRSGAWVFKGTRMPVSTVFDNLPDMTVDELVEEFGVTREQVEAVLKFVARSAEVSLPASRPY
jgi:uncharacterized protein (DUF433 family)